MLIDIKVPMLAESVSEATLVNWHKKPGEVIKRGQNLIDIETDKVTLEITAPEDGVLEEILKEDGMDVSSDEIIARINPNSSGLQQEDELQLKQTELPVLDESQVVDLNAHEDSPNFQDIKLSPAVRNMAENFNVDLTRVDHEKDRITKSNIIDHVSENKLEQSKDFDSTLAFTAVDKSLENSETVQPINTTTITHNVNDEAEHRVPMNRLRQRIAERLLNAQQENAILTTFNEVNMQPVMDLRKRYKDEFEQAHGVKLGFMSFFTKAVIEALKKFPVLNASVDGTDIVYHNYYDIGIAVSSPKGLFVPIVRNADEKNLAQIETEIRQYGDNAQNGQLDIQDMQGGTFTITNGGVFGSLLSTPILNPPQSAILGMHKIEDRPIAENNQVVIRPMMYLALSYDHRIIDGREAVQFLVAIKDQLEDPTRLLLQI